MNSLLGLMLSKVKDKKPLRIWFVIAIVIAIIFVIAIANSYQHL